MQQIDPNSQDYQHRYERVHAGVPPSAEEQANQLEELIDVRTPAQHDRDRILHSSALKRLAGVTQVVDPSEGQVFHNRLTHTLKVAQIARRIAEKLKQDLPEDVPAHLWIDPDVVEAAALAHDLGHPPFGHLSEKELDQMVYQSGLADGYEGNAQSFRILNRLEVHETDGSFPDSLVRGLDLTRATLNAVMKYPRLRMSEEDKWGAYLTEESIFAWTRRGSVDNRRSLEAEIMDFADDIAYSLHDLEDFTIAGLIPIAEILTSHDKRRKLAQTAVNDIKEEFKLDSEEQQTITESLTGFLLITPMGDPIHNTGKERATMRQWLSRFITRYVNSISIDERAADDPALRPVAFKREIRGEIRLLKEITKKHVINSRRLATQQVGKRRVIRELFQILMEALKSDGPAAKNILPEDFQIQLSIIQEELEKNEIKEADAAFARLVADMISSMTDNEALTIHKRLMGINPGSVMDMVFYSGFHLH